MAHRSCVAVKERIEEHSVIDQYVHQVIDQYLNQVITGYVHSVIIEV